MSIVSMMPRCWSTMYGITETTVHVSHIRVDRELALRTAESDRPRHLRSAGLTFWMIVWSLLRLGLLGSFNSLVLGLGGGIWVVGGECGALCCGRFGGAGGRMYRSGGLGALAV